MSLLPSSGSLGRSGLTGLLALSAVALTLSISACNTMAGLGQDVQAAGDAVSGTARDVQDDTE